MIIDSPAANQLPELKYLWKEAFGDADSFIDAFFSVGFSPDRCRCVKNTGILAALYWFDCPWQGKKLAYLYGIATREDHRGQGLCAALMEDAHRHLQSLGYAGAVLVPASPSLRKYYRRFGYENFGGVNEVTVSATKPLTLRLLSAEEYASLRQDLLPNGGVGLQGEKLTFFSRLAKLYAGDGFMFAAAWEDGRLRLPELLGDCPDMGGIAAALGVASVTVRAPGDAPFAMYLPLEENKKTPTYFGIALD